MTGELADPKACRRCPAPPASPSPVSLKLSDDERERLTTLAAARKRSSHYLMREAVRECLTREELRQAFADEAEKAWLDDERTGLHVTHAEIDAWEKSLGTRRPQRFPKWHKSFRGTPGPTSTGFIGSWRRRTPTRQPAPSTSSSTSWPPTRFPLLGPVDRDRPDARQLFIGFEAAGYVARYRVLDDTVTGLAVRHRGKAGYAEEPPSTLPPRARSFRRRRS